MNVETKVETLPRVHAAHLVKSVDLNHHGTLYAGRMADWVVETAFMTAQRALACPPNEIVCVRIHGLDFNARVQSGDTVTLEGRVAHTGRTSVTIYVQAGTIRTADRLLLDGFCTFVHVVGQDAAPHGLSLERPVDGAGLLLWDRAEELLQIAREGNRRRDEFMRRAGGAF